MMKISTRFLTLTLLLLIIGCAKNADELSLASSAQAPQPNVLNVEPKSCHEKGGVIKSTCMSRTPYCVISFSDAGKQCSDSSECLGRCQIKNQFVKEGTKTTGSCSANNVPCGCYQTVAKGIADYAICRD